MLVVDDHTHVGESRHHVGERRLRAEPVDREPEMIAAFVESGAERCGVGLVQRDQVCEVGDRLGGRQVLLAAC